MINFYYSSNSTLLFIRIGEKTRFKTDAVLVYSFKLKNTFTSYSLNNIKANHEVKILYDSEGSKKLRYLIQRLYLICYNFSIIHIHKFMKIDLIVLSLDY
ncbi:hypothetical protein BpHYR1_038960 [Brachionus plicatilis]|uniref:Uncharacterized protein n=1 Tax=Brachionus plicatilis TaxID=10195 RepID=A0A3M7R9F0_BRAPC|nr:hypothetical protein BpHYR1_038960 [Brachionus plicatilis]